MSDEETPHRALTKVGAISEIDRMKRALQVYRNWIWQDGRDIAELRTRMTLLEQDQLDLRAFINRILSQNMN